MSEATGKKLDDILRKIEALLRQADHPNTGKEEADVFRAKAEAMMYRYRIEESMLSKAQGPETLAPVWRRFHLHDIGNEYGAIYRHMAGAIVHHFDCKLAIVTGLSEDGLSSLSMDVCGYESDLRFINVLFNSAKLAFKQRLEPKYDPNLSDRENAYILRRAGLEGRVIAQMIYGRDDKPLRVKVRRMFKEEAEARGEDPSPLLGRGVSVKGYRHSYAIGFEDELWRRLYYMRSSRGEASQGLVLAGRADTIAEEFYSKYPRLRPAPAGTTAIGNEQAKCPKCAKAKSGYCREHSYMRPRAHRGPAINSAGMSAGRQAAREVDLGIQGRLDK